MLVFIHDKPGALFDVLSPFARHGISMNRIESRPSHQAKWEYGFFIDLAGHVEDESMKQALAELEAHSAQIKVLARIRSPFPEQRIGCGAASALTRHLSLHRLPSQMHC